MQVRSIQQDAIISISLKGKAQKGGTMILDRQSISSKAIGMTEGHDDGRQQVFVSFTLGSMFLLDVHGCEL
jgi:hypothetical protein